MLSVLIPTYNYNIVPLVLELQKQCIGSKIHFEILCQDDASSDFLDENQKINSLEHCYFSRNKSNLGRCKNRNNLAEKASYNWLLFMDCDTFPTQDNFIQEYIVQLSEKEKVVFGGLKYKNEKPSNDQLLRWIYGKARESLSLEKRKANPNENALTSNILIPKKLFIAIKFDESITKYGYEDLVFLLDLKKKGIVVQHIDNPIYHLGLETSKQFLQKTKIALENLKKLAATSSLDSSHSKILRTFILLQRLSLTKIISFIFEKTEQKMEQNLLSRKPSLLLFDLYKLGYYCSLKSL